MPSRNTFFLLSILWLFISPATVSAQNCTNVALANITNPGPYSYATMNQNDGIRNGPDYGNATIYYPTNATAPFASVAIVPGFTGTQASISAWGPFLASNGIVAITIDTNSPFNLPGDRAAALVDAIETLRQEDTRAGSPLLGLMDTNRFGVMGHSMGGGGAQLAASLDPSLKAVIAFTPWLSGPTAANLNHSVPVLIFSGENDPTAPVNQHADLHYNLTPNTTDKLLFEVANGNHSVANNPANSGGQIGQYGLSWLRNYLLDDPCYCPLVITPSSVTSSTLTNVVCPANCPTILAVNSTIADGTYHAVQTTTSNGTVPSGGIVSMKAGQSICLDAGFTVNLNADFEAIIEICQ